MACSLLMGISKALNESQHVFIGYIAGIAGCASNIWFSIWYQVHGSGDDASATYKFSTLPARIPLFELSRALVILVLHTLSLDSPVLVVLSVSVCVDTIAAVSPPILGLISCFRSWFKPIAPKLFKGSTGIDGSSANQLDQILLTPPHSAEIPTNMVPPLEDQGLAISGTAGEHSPICCSTPTIEVDLRTSDSTLVNEHPTPPLEPELSAIDISSLIEMPSLECSISSCDSECVFYTPGGNQNSVESVAPVEPAVIISHADNDIEVLIGMMERLKVSSDTWLPQKSTGRKTPKETGRLEAPSSVYGPILAGLD